jgi:hypothetical protein
VSRRSKGAQRYRDWQRRADIAARKAKAPAADRRPTFTDAEREAAEAAFAELLSRRDTREDTDR